MGSLNEQLFLMLNAAAGADPRVVLLARGLAEGAVPLAGAVVIALWVRRRERRAALLATGLALLLGLAANAIIGALWFHPRPFMIGLGHQLLAHAPETSFPSDHATALWSLGFGLAFTRASPGWGWFLVLLGAGIAWARVFLGVHFPFDMAGSLVVALAASYGAARLQRAVAGLLLPPAERLYDLGLALLHLPASIFPRGPERQ